MLEEHTCTLHVLLVCQYVRAGATKLKERLFQSNPVKKMFIGILGIGFEYRGITSMMRRCACVDLY